MKRKSKLNSVFEAWEKHRAADATRQERARPFEPGEVVDIVNSQDENRKNNKKQWDPFSASNFSPIASTSGIQYQNEESLKQLGYDVEAGKSIVYPVDEFIRPYEYFLTKKCLSINTCVSLPLGVSPVHILALTFANFSRWFPNCYHVCCCNHTEAAESFKSACVSVGFSEDDVTIVPNYNYFKKKESQIGKVIISTPQCLQKIVESESPIFATMRCMAVNLEPNEPLTKYNKFVGPLIGKGFFFRLLTTVPSFPDGSRRCSSISKRQQMITSLLISIWEEPRSTNPGFRLAAIPQNLQTVFWSNKDLHSSNVDLLKSWTEGFNTFIQNFPSSISLPSKEIDQLVNIDWREIKKQANHISSAVIEQCNIVSFLVTAYRHLLLSGVRVFYLYCKDTLNQQDNGSLSEQIQTAILTNVPLSNAFYTVQAEFAYNNDSAVNATFNNKSLSSHTKYPLLVSEIENYSKLGLMKGVILCESLNLSRTVVESIRNIPNCTTILGVPSCITIPPEYQENARNFNRMSGIFFEPKNVVVVLSFDEEAALAAFDTACSNNLTFIIAMDRRSISLAEYHTGEYKAILNDKYELLRDSDGKLVQEAVEPQVSKRWSTGAVGAVNKYSFKFEPSRLSLDLKQKKLQFVRSLEHVPSNNARIAQFFDQNINEDEGRKEKKPRKRPSVHNLPCIGGAKVQKRNVEVIQVSSEESIVFVPPRENRKSQLKVIDPKAEVIVLNDDDIAWNKSAAHVGNVPRSNLTKRFLKYISKRPNTSEVVETTPIRHPHIVPVEEDNRKPLPRQFKSGIILSQDDVAWNKTTSPVGIIPRSSITNRFLKFISDEPSSNEISERCGSKEAVEENKVIAAYDRVLGKLDTLLSM